MNAGPDSRTALALGQALVAIGRDRDRAAFHTLFAHFAPRVKGYLIRQRCNPAQAEEIAQETMVNVWRKAHLYDPAKATPATWVFTIARNLRIDAIRRDRRPDFDAEEPTLLPAAEPAPDDVLSDGQQARRVRAALDQLPDEQRQVVLLAFYEDKAHSEIAEHLGLPLGTVKSRLRLAFKKVRDALAAEVPA